MASAASRARERGEEGTHHTATKHRPDPEHLSGGGGAAKSRPERGRLGDAEAVSHRNHLRKGNFQPKLHLEHLAEKLKLLGLEGGGEEEQLCSWRKRTFAFREDAKASGRGAPRAHGGAHGEEPAQERREQIQRDLESLKKQREELLELKASGERRCQGYLTQTEAERQKIVSEFRQLRRFLKDQELVLLAQLGELDREVMRRQEEEEAKVSGEVSLLDILIWEMEKKLEQPASGFLQGGRSTVGRWEMGSGRRTMETSDLERRLRVISQQNDILREALGRFQDILPSELEKEVEPSLGGEGKAFVTLDPDTAHARLVLSRDRRGVRWTDAGQDLPPDPRCFDVSCCVLGCRGFSAGRHGWEVEVMAGGTWALGVARNSLPRKGCLEFRPEEGIWAVGCCGNRYRAFSSPPATLPTSGNPKRIRVVLDYEGEQVAFYLTAQLPPVFAFQKACFGGESIFPFFWVGRGSHLHLCA
ncbi:tripartite motif-containing protein 10-like isoform X2 [Oxyura jamaicensis]|nr:tripartite motif-containing protein 10-like isoform X2 [Oxyura jamaicensis]XP_035197084.1 tripartite motif-containing protein 10-like isoform X2 [Oxyura jamaicensis]